MSTHIDLSPENPWRAPDWCWQRAALLARNELQPSRVDDRTVKRATKFLRSLDRSETAGDTQLLFNRDPALYWAHRLYQGQNEMYSLRAELEARILANDNPERMSTVTGLSEQAIQNYEQMFFDVRSRLKCSGFILHVIIGTALHRGFTERDYQILWKFYGYTYGPDVLEALITQRIPSDLQGTFRDDEISSILRKSVLAARTVPVNTFTQMDLLNVRSKFLEVDKAQPTGGTNSAADMARIASVMETVVSAIGDFADDQGHSPIIREFDQSSSELTTVQLMQAAQGRLGNKLQPYNLTYPPIEVVDNAGETIIETTAETIDDTSA